MCLCRLIKRYQSCYDSVINYIIATCKHIKANLLTYYQHHIHGHWFVMLIKAFFSYLNINYCEGMLNSFSSLIWYVLCTSTSRNIRTPLQKYHRNSSLKPGIFSEGQRCNLPNAQQTFNNNIMELVKGVKILVIIRT